MCKLKRDKGLRLDGSSLRKRAFLGSGCGGFSQGKQYLYRIILNTVFCMILVEMQTMQSGDPNIVLGNSHGSVFTNLSDCICFFF